MLLAQFKEIFLKLPDNYQNIIKDTILRMEKKHFLRKPKKVVNINKTIKFYLKKNRMKESELISMCFDRDESFSVDTYYSIKKRNLVNTNDNVTLKLICSILNIPTTDNGIPYIVHSYTLPFSKTFHKSISFTNDYSCYMSEFQNNSVFDNFLCLSAKNQKAVLFLTSSLYYNISFPDFFLDSDVHPY